MVRIHWGLFFNSTFSQFGGDSHASIESTDEDIETIEKQMQEIKLDLNDPFVVVV